MYQPPHIHPPFSPIDTYSSPRNILRFSDFHARHFTQKNFFLHALNPNPWPLWGTTEGSENGEQRPGEEAISMFRFSELRKQQLAEASPSSASQNKSSEKFNDSSTSMYLTSEPDPSLISPTNLTTIELQQLYGDSYPNITILEAAVNSAYVQSCKIDKDHDDGNRNEIVYWPVVPLRFA
ncbi:17272_t:CDS:2 [Cetraspora pellucida]|uniref:17272_t:CDS:1 n=1 Tax=Cetraspora pellucida TaxID=1433469 RepID=A0A9N9NLF8_9GLOM|nr:17272_t:CDS:2 [Cetraspora pellucida]